MKLMNNGSQCCIFFFAVGPAPLRTGRGCNPKIWDMHSVYKSIIFRLFFPTISKHEIPSKTVMCLELIKYMYFNFMILNYWSKCFFFYNRSSYLLSFMKRFTGRKNNEIVIRHYSWRITKRVSVKNWMKYRILFFF